MLVLVLLLLLGSPRVRRDIASDPVEPRVRGFWPSRGKTIIVIFACGLPLLFKRTPVVGRMAEAVPPSIVAVRPLARPRLLKIIPVVRRMSGAVPACNLAMWALTKAPLVSGDPVFVLVCVLRWWW